MSRPIVPIASLQRRLPTAGRLRLGRKVPTKGGKTRPEKIDTWRATSHDREAIEQIAAAYGGTPEAWEEPKAAPGQWQVITTAAELPIVLPPDPLGDTPIYEMWSGGGCERRCDGETCTVIVTHGEDTEYVEVPCKCAAAGELACKVKIRLSVILPAVKFAGVWRVESSGWNAATELPGMVDLIQSLQAQGLTRGLLALEPRRQVTGGRTRHFMVPCLRVAESMDAIVSGAAQVRALASVPVSPALGAGTPANGDDDDVPSEPADDDEVVEGEVVDQGDDEAGEPAPPSAAAKARAQHLAIRCKTAGLDDDGSHALIEVVTKGRTASGLEVTKAEFDEVCSTADAIKGGLASLSTDTPAGAFVEWHEGAPA